MAMCRKEESPIRSRYTRRPIPFRTFRVSWRRKESSAFSKKRTGATLVVCLISGGGSALLVAPHKDISLAEKQQITQLLLKAGANIQELNTVRKHLSRIKGGRLAEIAYPARVLSLILSDVIGDPLDVIASGPTSPDQTTFEDALKVIKRYDLGDKIPEKARLILIRGAAGEIAETPKEGNPVFARVQNIIVGSNKKAIETAKREAEGHGVSDGKSSPRICRVRREMQPPGLPAKQSKRAGDWPEGLRERSVSSQAGRQP